jgi:hypothetical protein
MKMFASNQRVRVALNGVGIPSAQAPCAAESELVHVSH